MGLECPLGLYWESKGKALIMESRWQKKKNPNSVVFVDASRNRFVVLRQHAHTALSGSSFALTCFGRQDGAKLASKSDQKSMLISKGSFFLFEKVLIN